MPAWPRQADNLALLNDAIRASVLIAKTRESDMNEAPWKRLVEELKDQGYESVYLDRLRANLDVEQQHGILEKEVVQEIAYALGRSAAKVDHALLELELLLGELRQTTSALRRQALLQEIAKKREEALARRRELLIHREAVGIRRNDILERLYPVADLPR